MPAPRPNLTPSLDWLLVLVPVAIVLELAGGPDLAIFLTSAGAILPLAGLIGRSPPVEPAGGSPLMGAYSIMASSLYFVQ